MIAAITYIVRRFWYRAVEFLRHWYVKSGRMYFNFLLDRLTRLDYTLAWKITARHLFQPLYRDYSMVGYLFGFLFRGARLVLASAVYLALFGVALGAYLLWLLVPPILLVLAFSPLVL